MFKRLIREVFASKSSVMFLVIIVVCLLLIDVAGISSCSMTQINAKTETNELDASGLSADETQNLNNSLNFSQLPDSSFIYDVSIEEVATADSYMENQTVQVVGEVVGDRIYSSDANDDSCWITLQSTEQTDSVISVYMTRDAAEAIDTFGAYGKRGTLLQVRGIFNLACRDHHGTSEIHADNVAVVQKGKVEVIPFDIQRLLPGIILLLIGSVLMLLYNILGERQR